MCWRHGKSELRRGGVVPSRIEHRRLERGDANALLAALNDEFQLIAVLRNGALGHVREALAVLGVDVVGDQAAEVEATAILVRFHGDILGKVLPVVRIERLPVALGGAPKRLRKNRVGDGLNFLHFGRRQRSVECSL